MDVVTLVFNINLIFIDSSNLNLQKLKCLTNIYISTFLINTICNQQCKFKDQNKFKNSQSFKNVKKSKILSS